MDGACWVCFYCQTSPVLNSNIGIFLVRAMECMCAQTRPRFTLSSERVLGNGVRTHVNSKGNIPLYWMLRAGSNPRHCFTQDSEPNTLPIELIRPGWDLNPWTFPTQWATDTLRADTVVEIKLDFKLVKTTGHCSTVQGTFLIVLDFCVTSTSSDTLVSKGTLTQTKAW